MLPAPIISDQCEVLFLEPKDYIVIKFDGDYAVLKDLNGGEEMLIARALLPEESDEGSRLHWEDLVYTVTG